jgi:hypothetical protein
VKVDPKNHECRIICGCGKRVNPKNHECKSRPSGLGLALKCSHLMSGSCDNPAIWYMPVIGDTFNHGDPVFCERHKSTLPFATLRRLQ